MIICCVIIRWHSSSLVLIQNLLQKYFLTPNIFWSFDYQNIFYSQNVNIFLETFVSTYLIILLDFLDLCKCFQKWVVSTETIKIWFTHYIHSKLIIDLRYESYCSWFENCMPLLIDSDYCHFTINIIIIFSIILMIFTLRPLLHIYILGFSFGT